MEVPNRSLVKTTFSILWFPLEDMTKYNKQGETQYLCIGASVRRSSSRRSGGRLLAMT